MGTPVPVAAAALAAALAAASGPAAAALPLSPPACEPAEEVSTGAFAAGLLAAASEGGTRNALVSPLGIGVSLEMLAPGARAPVRRAIRDLFEAPGAGPGDGSAAGASNGDGPDGGGLSCQLAQVRYDAARGDAVEVQAAHAAFADRRLDLFPAYSAAIRDGFGARVERLDFTDGRSVGRINAWAAEATGGAFPHLVSRLDPDDALLLVNAMRFEGEWAERFDPDRTVPAPFHLRTGAAPEVPTMHARWLPARYREDEGFQAVALPYGDGRFELVAVLPRAGVEAPEALRRLAADPSWLGGRGFHLARGALALPRLALDVEASLLPVLRALGLGAALDDPRAFAGIAAPAPELSRMLHRAKLVLDEEGTEAVAVTVSTVQPTSVEVEVHFEMRVDRPFALAVLHGDTGAVLFTAWVDDPAAGER